MKLDDDDERSKYAGLRIHALLTPKRRRIDLDKIILPTDVRQLFASTLILQMSGPISTLDAKLLRMVCHFLADSAVNSLARTCKRFNHALMNDEVWQYRNFASCKWQGAGWKGHEKDEWEAVRIEAGLTLSNINRMRWLTHHTSRLKLHYGGLNLTSPTFLQRILARSATELEMVQHLVVLIGDDESVRRMMRTMHFIVPESATAYHNTADCSPLLPELFLTDVEPSPEKCRSRVHIKDPGTRIERSVDGTVSIRRIGDRRMTFLGVEPRVFHNPLPHSPIERIQTKVNLHELSSYYQYEGPTSLH